MDATNRHHVLLVDDDEEIVAAVRFALEHAGYEVSVAADGTEALMRIERERPDLVLLDAVMPRRSGLIVLDRLRRHAGPSPPIIMMSGQNDPELEAFVLARGVNAFLRKPFDVEELLARVNSLLAEAAE
jgi:DNA-binding response OmpR family regulator